MVEGGEERTGGQGLAEALENLSSEAGCVIEGLGGSSLQCCLSRPADFTWMTELKKQVNPRLTSPTAGC